MGPILFNNKMSCRILQNNHLFRRIEHKNIFKTFSKTYNRRSMTPQQYYRSKLNYTLEQNSKVSTVAIEKLTNYKPTAPFNDSSAINSERYELQTSIPLHIHQKYSIKLFPQTVESRSKTAPIDVQLQEMRQEKKFSRECMTTLGSKSNASETILLNWNQKRKKEEFKLKACFDKDKAAYDAPYDQTEFSTLEAKKNEEVISRREGRYQNKWRGVLRENNKELASLTDLSIGNTKRGAFILSKYSKFVQEGIKSNTELLNRTKK